MAELAPRNVRLRKSEKLTIGRFWISSATTNSASKITDAKSFSRVISADQPMRLAPISAQMRQKRPPPNKSMPAMSSLCASGSRDSSTASVASQMSAAPTGIFTRKAQRQPNPEVMRPPTSGPTATATPTTVPQNPNALARSAPRNSCPAPRAQG